MFGGWGPGWRIGRFLGIDVEFDASLIILGGLITWSLYLSFDAAFPRVAPAALATVSVLGGALFLGSVLVHELSHSVVARSRGLPVRRIRLFLFGGVSEIEGEAVSPRDEFMVAVVGPLSSLVLALLLFIGYLVQPESWPTGRLALVLAVVNVALGVFNLAPGFPLDGGRVLRAIVWGATGDRRRATRVAVAAGKAVAALVMAAGFFVLFRWSDLGGLWYVAIGWFLYQAAAATLIREKIVDALEGKAVGEFMTPSRAPVDGDVPVGEFVNRYVLGERWEPHPVIVAGRVRGIVGPEQVRGVDDPASTPLSSVMQAIGPDDVVPSARPIVDVLGRLASPDVIQVVVRDGRMVGLLHAADLHRHLRRIE